MKFLLPCLPRAFVPVFAASVMGAAMAAEVSDGDAARAAGAFVSSDAVGSVVLKGRTVSGVARRGHLWIAALSPSGHIVLSGSDIADPIVGFSRNDFAEPDPASPAFAVLGSADASVAALEAQGGGTRHARWTKLLGGGIRGVLAMADNPSNGAIVVEPFLAGHFDQWQPYNDYAPVYEPDAASATWYRGRCPCGCVATAAAQVFHHFKWPARIDSTISHYHEFTDSNKVSKTFQIRFDGHAPIDWNAISNSYSYLCYKPVTNHYSSGHYSVWSEPCYDLRGVVAESVRYPIARLILWCDVMAKMQFTPDGSSSSYEDVASNVSEWYTQGRWVKVCTGADYSQIISDLQAGVPLQVSLYGHQVVAHGWAAEGDSSYIYLNYGWGGSDDGYYNMDNSTIDLPIQAIYVGHYPRAKPQIDPLPAVSGTSLTLDWHFPDIYTNKLSGFEVSIQKMGTKTKTFTDNFTATTGTSDAENGSINSGEYDKIYVGTDSQFGFGRGKLLYVEPLAIGHFTYGDKLILTSSSKLSFRLRSVYAEGCAFEIQARFNDEDWTTVYTPSLSVTSDSTWKTHQSIDLGGHAGETALFRVNKGFEGDSYYQEGRILLDDFSVSNVLMAETTNIVAVGADSRSYGVTGLADGRAYCFAVKPVLDASALVAGEKSVPVSSTIGAGSALGMPEILSVSDVTEGFYGECGTNATEFAVTCSGTVESLAAYASHRTLVGPNDVSVANEGGGKFKVSVTPRGINETNFRSRMILTLVATDSNGTKCYKDLSLRFEPVEEAASEVVVSASDSGGTPYSVTIPYSWIESKGLAAAGSDAAAHEAAVSATADADSDGLPNWAEYVCGTSPTDPSEKVTVSIEMVDGAPVVTYTPADSQIAEGFKAVIKGTTDLSAALSNWEVVTETRTSTCRFFRVEIVPDK